MLDQLDEISSPHPPHILRTFMPLVPLYGSLEDDDNFKRLIDDVCRLVELNPVPWLDVHLDREAIFRRSDQRTLCKVNELVYLLKAEADGAQFWCCKSMANVHYAAQLEESGIRPYYIHLYRDGRDVALSFKKAVVGHKHVYHIARQWALDQDRSLELHETLGSRRVIGISYEHLLASPRQTLTAICAFLGVKYSDQALSYYQSEEASNTAKSGKMWENVVKPILVKNTCKYRGQLSAEEIRIFESVAGSTLQRLGYSLDFPDSPKLVFTEEQIMAFDRENSILRKEAKKLITPAELRSREKQESLVAEIRLRETSYSTTTL